MTKTDRTIKKEYSNVGFIKRSLPWLLPGAIVIPGIITAIYIRNDGNDIQPIYYVLIGLLIIKYLSIIYSFRYCITGIELNPEEKNLLIKYTDFFIKKKMECPLNSLIVEAKISTHDFKGKDKSGSKLMIGCKKHLIKTRNNEVLFIKQYIDLIELLDLNINRKIAISFNSILKYLDDDTKERIQKLRNP